MQLMITFRSNYLWVEWKFLFWRSAQNSCADRFRRLCRWKKI